MSEILLRLTINKENVTTGQLLNLHSLHIMYLKPLFGTIGMSRTGKKDGSAID